MNILNWLKNWFGEMARPEEYDNTPIDIFPSANTGVLKGRKDTDFIAGALPYKIILPNGDWRPFAVVGEKQSYQSFDSMACVSYSNNNSAEIQLKQSTGLEYNFSDEALAYLSGTTLEGNYLYKPADSARTQGRILQKDWFLPNVKSWVDLQNPLPREILAKAVFFNESYQWIGTNRETLKYYLKQSPIQIVINGGKHAVCLVYVDEFYCYYFDSYPPYFKKTSELPSSALQIIVKPMAQFVHLQKTQEYGFYLGAKDEEMLKLKGEANGIPVAADGGAILFSKAKEIKFV